MRSPLDILAVVGLAAAAALGLTGTLVTDVHVQGLLWALDAVGLVVATAVLALRYFRRGRDGVAAGFLEPLLPTSSPLPFFGYPVLVATFIGWSRALLRDGRPR